MAATDGPPPGDSPPPLCPHRRWRNRVVVAAGMISGAAAFVAFFGRTDGPDLIAVGVAVAGAVVLSIWNFDLERQPAPSWSSIERWVGRGLARISYVALFGIPVAASFFDAIETAPPAIFLLGYLSSLCFAVGRTAHLQAGRVPQALDTTTRWTAGGGISLGFLCLLLLFWVQARDLVEAYGHPRREVGLEGARRALHGVDDRATAAGDAVERSLATLEAIRLDAAATGLELRRSARTLSEEARATGRTAEEIRQAALDLQELVERLLKLLEEIEAERKKIEDRFRIFR